MLTEPYTSNISVEKRPVVCSSYNTHIFIVIDYINY